MCFDDGLGSETISRGDALEQLAAVGLLPAVSASAPASAAQPQNEGAHTTAFTGATAFVGDGLSELHNATILVRGNRIVEVGAAPAVHIPSGTKRIKLDGKYIIPGLIDSHVHSFQSAGLFTRPDTVDLRSVRPYEDELKWIHSHLTDTFARYLRAGITSVSDVGGPFWNYEVRALASRTRVAPRVAAAGPLISSVERAILDPHGDPPIVKIDHPDGARALVRREHERNTDFVKLWWVVDPAHPVEAFVPVAKAAMDQSKELKLRVAVHALELETARAAAKTGTDILVHSVFDKDVDDAFVALLKSRGIIYCPTLRVSGGYQSTFAERPELSIQDLRFANPETVGTLFMIQDIPGADSSERVARSKHIDTAQFRAAAMRNLKRLHREGVTIATGTDAGNIGTLHASSLHAEMVTMSDAGLTPKDVLIATTLNGAKHMAREHELGTIAAGKFADLVVLDESPLADIRNTALVHLVVKDGLVFNPNELAKDTPDQVVQREANAFNAHNAEALSELFASGVQMEYRSDVVDSRHGIAAYFRDLFARFPAIHMKILSRHSQGGEIVREEEVSGAGGPPVRSRTTLRVRDLRLDAMQVRTV